MATFLDMKTFVYDVLQTDETDLPSTVLLVFANESTRRILQMRNNWPHLYLEGTLAVVAGTDQYTLASASFNPQTFKTVESVWDDSDWGRSLEEIDFQEGESIWLGENRTQTDPCYFSVYNGKLNLYPLPADSETFRIGGYKSPTDMTVDGSIPDLPSEFHAAVQYATVALAHAQAEDYEGSAFWRSLANDSYRAALGDLFTNRVHRPIVLHGRGRYYAPRYDQWVRRMVP